MMVRRAALVGLAALAAMAGCGGDDGGSPAATTERPSATPPLSCVEAVSGFPDNGLALVQRCDHLRDVLAATAAGGQELTAGEAAVAVRELCVQAAGEDGWETATPLCAEAAEVFAAGG